MSLHGSSRSIALAVLLGAVLTGCAPAERAAEPASIETMNDEGPPGEGETRRSGRDSQPYVRVPAKGTTLGVMTGAEREVWQRAPSDLLTWMDENGYDASAGLVGARLIPEQDLVEIGWQAGRVPPAELRLEADRRGVNVRIVELPVIPVGVEEAGSTVYEAVTGSGVPGFTVTSVAQPGFDNTGFVVRGILDPGTDLEAVRARVLALPEIAELPWPVDVSGDGRQFSSEPGVAVPENG